MFVQISIESIISTNYVLAKLMGNGAQHAIATAVAAHLCRKHVTNPAGIYEYHLSELQTIVAGITGADRIKSHL